MKTQEREIETNVKEILFLTYTFRYAFKKKDFISKNKNEEFANLTFRWYHVTWDTKKRKKNEGSMKNQ